MLQMAFDVLARVFLTIRTTLDVYMSRFPGWNETWQSDESGSL